MSVYFVLTSDIYEVMIIRRIPYKSSALNSSPNTDVFNSESFFDVIRQFRMAAHFLYPIFSSWGYKLRSSLSPILREKLSDYAIFFRLNFLSRVTLETNVWTKFTFNVGKVSLAVCSKHLEWKSMDRPTLYSLYTIAPMQSTKLDEKLWAFFMVIHSQYDLTVSLIKTWLRSGTAVGIYHLNRLGERVQSSDKPIANWHLVLALSSFQALIKYLIM